MCGRFAQIEPLADIIRAFFIDEVLGEFRPSYNVAPGQEVPSIISRDGKRVLTPLRWGLVPSWAKDPAMGSRMINARAETVHQKPSFRSAFRSRRCLIPASGFYEWRKRDRSKIPVFIRLSSREPFAFAGLYERWAGPDREIRSCTIITTDANELLQPVHDRMPVIIPPDKQTAWLASDDPDEARSLLVPYPPGEMEFYPVSTLVNSPANNIPDCITPA